MSFAARVRSGDPGIRGGKRFQINLYPPWGMMGADARAHPSFSPIASCTHSLLPRVPGRPLFFSIRAIFYWSSAPRQCPSFAGGAGGWRRENGPGAGGRSWNKAKRMDRAGGEGAWVGRGEVMEQSEAHGQGGGGGGRAAPGSHHPRSHGREGGGPGPYGRT